MIVTRVENYALLIKKAASGGLRVQALLQQVLRTQKEEAFCDAIVALAVTVLMII